MRTHSILALIVMTSLAACAGEPEDMSRQVTLPDDASTADAVASDIEVGEQVEAAPAQRAARADVAPRTSIAAEDNAGTAPAMPDVTAYVVSSPARLHAPVLTVSRPAVAVAAAVDETADDQAPASGDDDAFRPRPGVIIRGGVTENDDCKLHMPGNGRIMTPPRAGVLINERGPRVGLPSIRPGGIR